MTEMQNKVPTHRRETTTRIVDKMLRNVWNIGYIQMLLPQACIIQVRLVTLSGVDLAQQRPCACVAESAQCVQQWPSLDPADSSLHHAECAKAHLQQVACSRSASQWSFLDLVPVVFEVIHPFMRAVRPTSDASPVKAAI